MDLNAEVFLDKNSVCVCSSIVATSCTKVLAQVVDYSCSSHVYSCYDIRYVRYIVFHFHEIMIYAMLHRHVKEDGIEGNPIL